MKRIYIIFEMNFVKYKVQEEQEEVSVEEEESPVKRREIIAILIK